MRENDKWGAMKSLLVLHIVLSAHSALHCMYLLKMKVNTSSTYTCTSSTKNNTFVMHTRYVVTFSNR